MKAKEMYEEIMSIADRLEKIRTSLYVNKEHKENMRIYNSNAFQSFDDNLFKLQSDLRNLVEDELYWYTD